MKYLRLCTYIGAHGIEKESFPRVAVGQVHPSSITVVYIRPLLLPVMSPSNGVPNTLAAATPEQPEQHASDDLIIEHRVWFFPILSEQRKLWILTIIREERVASLLDVGCGEGSLLWSLSNPAYWLADTLPGFVYAHLHTLHGLDISEESLAQAKIAITPSPPTFYSLPRWEHLSASLWRGGLQRTNEEFKGIECIVASEVIEHLPAHAFAAFAPVLLGYYAPRLLLLTTPSYSFNRLFVAPPSSTPGREDPWSTWGYPSPTQPGRRMRHDDHQFEWTPAEAREWCAAEAEAWGYDFKLSGVGISTEVDPWGRSVEDDGEAGGRASLVIEFRRREGDEADERRKKAWEAWCQGKGSHYAEDEPHELVVAIEHAAHECGGKPQSKEEIAEVALQAMRQRRSAEVHLGDFWDKVAVACGGSRAVLVEALDQDLRFDIAKEDKDAQRWRITLLGEEGEIAKDWREEPIEDMHEYSGPDGDDDGDEGDEAGWAEQSAETALDGQETVWEFSENSSTNTGWDTQDEPGWGAGSDHGGWSTSSNQGGWDIADNEGNLRGWGTSDKAQ